MKSGLGGEGNQQKPRTWHLNCIAGQATIKVEEQQKAWQHQKLKQHHMFLLIQGGISFIGLYSAMHWCFALVEMQLLAI